MHSITVFPLLLFVLLAIATVPLDGYSGGAPPQACSTMIPQHGGVAQDSPLPINIVLDKTTVDGGNSLSVTLADNGGKKFKGFFIQAMDPSGSAVGKFSTKEHKKLSCGSDAVDNGVTHTSSDPKSQVVVEWTAPFEFEGDINFKVTVVESFTTFWVGHNSSKVSVTKRSAPALSETTVRESTDPVVESSNVEATQVTAVGPKGLAKSLNDLYNDCGTLKTCLGLPPGCEKDKKCHTLVTYTKAGGDDYEFELKGEAPNGRNKYVAVGLSADDKMGDDSVVMCTAFNSEVDVRMSWNQGRSNVDVIDPKLGLTSLESGLFEGELYCRFHRKAKTEIKAKQFDLDNVKFHIMLANGPITNDAKPQYHGSGGRIVSVQPQKLGTTSNIAVRDGRLFRMIHGSLMIGAWICTASIGMLFARYYKQTWLQAKCCGLDQWFHYHRFFMVATWSLSIAALVLIIVELEEWRPSNHSWIGLSSVVLCFIQPFMAMLRPHPGTKRRPLFNWAHWFVGNAAQILGITAIFFGFELFFGTSRHWLKEVGWYLLVVFIGIHCIIHLVLTISHCIGDQRTAANDIFPLKELTDSRAPLQPENKRRDAPLSCFRKFILALYLPLNWIITALLIIIVVVKKEDIEDQLKEWGIPEVWKEKEM